MSAYKEIVTKAIIGKGKKYYKNTYTIETENEPSTVLGCWVINHKFKGTDVGGKIVIDGSFDVNIWYSYNNDTKTTVITKKIKYSEAVMVNQRETTDSTNKDIIVRSLKQPNCVTAKEDGKNILIDIEKEYNDKVIKDLQEVKEKTVYTIEFSLTKDKKGEWSVDLLTNDIENKLLGIY